jgi:hypothetical protein
MTVDKHTFFVQALIKIKDRIYKHIKKSRRLLSATF